MERLPEEILVDIVSRLEPLEDSLSNLPCVCRSWSQTFNTTRFWTLLAKSRNLSIGRHRRHAKRSFFQRYFQARKAEKNEADRFIIQLGKRLERSDCVAYIRKQLSTNSPTCSIVHHKVTCWEHRTLLHMACWRGRVKTVKMLLEEHHPASLLELDDSNASPLLLAAWSGHANVVRALLVHYSNNKQRHFLNEKGVPPLTSSCGGRGPKTALCWAKRKGFHPVVRLLENAGATAG